MAIPRLHSRIGKVCALVAATLVLPTLAYTQDNQGQNNNNQGTRIDDTCPGIVLLATTIGAVLLFSFRQSSRAKAGSQR